MKKRRIARKSIALMLSTAMLFELTLSADKMAVYGETEEESEAGGYEAVLTEENVVEAGADYTVFDNGQGTRKGKVDRDYFQIRCTGKHGQ